MKERTRVKKHKDNFMGNRATYALSGDDSIASSRWELLFFRIKAVRRFWNLDSTAFAPSQRLKAIMSGLAPSSLGNTYFLFYGRKKKIKYKWEILLWFQATSRAMVFKLQCASELPRDFVKMQILIPSVWGLRFYSRWRLCFMSTLSRKILAPRTFPPTAMQWCHRNSCNR